MQYSIDLCFLRLKLEISILILDLLRYDLKTLEFSAFIDEFYILKKSQNDIFKFSLNFTETIE